MSELEILAQRCRDAWSRVYGSTVVTPWERMSPRNRESWLAVARVKLETEGR